MNRSLKMKRVAGQGGLPESGKEGCRELLSAQATEGLEPGYV